MKKSIMSVLLLTLLAAMSHDTFAQNKGWATLSGDVLKFTYGTKPKAPSQIECTGCGRKISYSSNFCSNCGAKIKKDFIVFEVLNDFKDLPPWVEHFDYDDKSLKRIIIDPSFKQKTGITNMSGWFKTLRGLKRIDGLQYLNTSQVTNMSNMFYDCPELEAIDVSHFDTRNVTDMSAMFCGLRKVKIIDVSRFNTSKVKDMSSLFGGCHSLTSLDVSHFDTRNVTNMDDMFLSCKNLKSLNLSSFKTANVVDMSAMFLDCTSLTTLDISNFDTRKAEMGHMFKESSLKTIYVSKQYWVPNPSHVYDRIEQVMDGCKAEIIKK